MKVLAGGSKKCYQLVQKSVVLSGQGGVVGPQFFIKPVSEHRVKNLPTWPPHGTVSLIMETKMYTYYYNKIKLYR